ncbi:MAG: hypothetical protein A2499_04990 [Stygiobacter sp. RIFOXYC12_FULL_38_8]|nr:MAG: hypothetical protein A2299_16360 [Stygiobacter sp. RIFOXYB2_FULL_37_11]OGV13481.1 MAG: hypothetical protein A2237_17055 [Stygiobacter sp. RIFOXYA2_FULL_38_8]OGV14772.1 MAG: hypothetical protein A2440_09740 [Stygiobacter sp. RIFOXYC2_FULL_38_25]OGV22307.1 MAG: hypothetical protein A2499_04990 [Stygiobacter sp. RIFOXYC12_FULL_38_8]OGV79265.1 MAG: hypothetical protein A2X65_02110 [Stygiobacter sp. GWF2_38_21]
MVADSQLKTGRLYFCEVIKASRPCFGKEFVVKFTGIAFRNINYDTERVFDFIDDDREAVRKRLKERNGSNKPDAIFMLDEIKIYREAQPELFNANN